MIRLIRRAFASYRADRARKSIAAENDTLAKRRADRAERSRLAKNARAASEARRLRECHDRFVGGW